MGTRFIFSLFTHDIASSYLEVYNFIKAAVSSPSNSMGHSVFLLWGYESQGFISRWFIMGGLCIFLGFHGLAAQAPFVFGSSKFLVLFWHQALERNSINRSYHHVRFSFHCSSTRSSQLVLRSQLRCSYYFQVFIISTRVL